MDCEEIRELLPAHVDQELGLPEAIEIDKHLQSCPACHREFSSQKTLRAALQKGATYFKAPSHVEKRVRESLPLVPEQPAQPAKAGRRWTGSWHWINLGASLASVVALAWSVGLYLATPSPTDLLLQDVVSSHVRSLMVEHIADVASSDHHTVKPWFNGKLDFSPPVDDLTTQGFPLVGGRLDYLNHRSVAALVYRHRKHLINVYVWPAANGRQTTTQSASSQGYHLIHWAKGGMVYWMISDLNSGELMTLAQLIQEQTKREPA